jgi:hypothetical protein
MDERNGVDDAAPPKCPMPNSLSIGYFFFGSRPYPKERDLLEGCWLSIKTQMLGWLEGGGVFIH